VRKCGSEQFVTALTLRRGHAVVLVCPQSEAVHVEAKSGTNELVVVCAKCEMPTCLSHNLYAPTLAVLWASYYEYTRPHPPHKSLPMSEVHAHEVWTGQTTEACATIEAMHSCAHMQCAVTKTCMQMAWHVTAMCCLQLNQACAIGNDASHTGNHTLLSPAT
jgi:hypothetical protein